LENNLKSFSKRKSNNQIKQRKGNRGSLFLFFKLSLSLRLDLQTFRQFLFGNNLVINLLRLHDLMLASTAEDKIKVSWGNDRNLFNLDDTYQVIVLLMDKERELVWLFGAVQCEVDILE